MARYFKPVLGIVFIVLAFVLLFFWEVAGREAVLMENVLVAEKDILPETIVSATMFKEVGMLSESLIENGINKKDISMVEGKVAKQLILKNSQIAGSFFSEKSEEIKGGDGIFQIKANWIFSVSSSLRKGDLVDLYSLDGKLKWGHFKVAFVKDDQGKEVFDGENSIGHMEILKRQNGSAIVANFEIVATLDSYTPILIYVFSNDGKLIVVNRKNE